MHSIDYLSLDSMPGMEARECSGRDLGPTRNTRSVNFLRLVMLLHYFRYRQQGDMVTERRTGHVFPTSDLSASGIQPSCTIHPKYFARNFPFTRVHHATTYAVLLPDKAMCGSEAYKKGELRKPLCFSSERLHP